MVIKSHFVILWLLREIKTGSNEAVYRTEVGTHETQDLSPQIVLYNIHMKNVAIIGGGPAGLSAAINLLEEFPGTDYADYKKVVA